MRRLSRLAPLVALLAALAPPLAAQIVEPGSRVLVLDAGKSGTVKITDEFGCSPTWTAVSANEAVATVKPDTAKAGGKRSFKVKAAKNLHQAMTNVTITLQGTGAGCEQTQMVELQVVVVRKQKHAESMTKKAGNKEAKAFQKFLKGEEKELDQMLDGLSLQLAMDLEAVGDDEGGMTALEQKQALLFAALRSGLLLYSLFMANLFDTYGLHHDNVVAAAQAAIFNYAYLPFLAATLLVGGGGIWDAVVLKLLSVARVSASKATARIQQYVTGLALIAVLNGVPVTAGFRDFVDSVCYPDLCGPYAPTPTDTDGGSEGNPFLLAAKLQLLMISPWTLFTPDGPRAAFVAAGLAHPDDGEVTVVVRRHGSEIEVPASLEYDEDTGTWYAEVYEEDLFPDKYDFVVRQADVELVRLVDVAAR